MATAAAPTWQRQGYPKLAALMSYYPNTRILRKFGELQFLSLMMIQAKLQDLETEYHRICEEDDAARGTNREKLSSSFLALSVATGEDQKRILEEIKNTILDYSTRAYINARFPYH